MYKYNFLCLPETYLDSKIPDCPLEIDGYNLVRAYVNRLYLSLQVILMEHFRPGGLKISILQKEQNYNLSRSVIGMLIIYLLTISQSLVKSVHFNVQI